MHILQIWSIWSNTAARCTLRHGPQYNKRKNLYFLMVLVYRSCFAYVAWSLLEVYDHDLARKVSNKFFYRRKIS